MRLARWFSTVRALLMVNITIGDLRATLALGGQVEDFTLPDGQQLVGIGGGTPQPGGVGFDRFLG